MNPDNVKCVTEFPLTPKSARKLIADLATYYSYRVKFSKHARQRLTERKVSTQQVFSLLRSSSSRFQELPHQDPRGDWKMNLEGMAAGELLRVSLVLKRVESDPSAFIVTVLLP
ncbi:DUF4258 domain-containing protein [Vibrio sp. JC009]|uniref:DUF4258 domain-containing protein n=1 Tax=Vibrio sp. JC009 TaxID=2912314 RepID=UPI0023AFECFD|nr:DUF4258 domain-containing protein [Vibrio sp. JC009]WED21827.1 DUF4258 domain-containing protein [Vibrio sp. JC009]